MARLVEGTRVEFICPCSTATLFLATNEIISFLREEVTVREWGGFTYSSLHPTVFTGQFWDTDMQNWVSDENVLIFLDVPGLSAAEFVPYLHALRAQIDATYVHADEAQKAIWITAHAISVLVD